MATEETAPKPTEEQEKPTEEPKQVFHCSYCGSELTPVETPMGTRYRCPQCARMVRPIEKERRPPEEEEVLPPSDVEARKFIVEELLERLDTVYGIPKKKVAPIAATVEDNPQIALNPTALYWHIKQLAAQANDYQLYLFISGLFNKLREKGLLAHAAPMPIMGMPQFQQQTQPYPFMVPPMQQQPHSPFNPYGVTPFGTTPYGVTPFGTQRQMQPFEVEDYSERIARARRKQQMEEEEHKLRMAKLEAEIKAMTQKREPSNVVTVVEPMRDEEGRILKDEKGNILFRKISGPPSEVKRSSVEDPELRFLTKLEKYKTLLKPELDETKVKEIIRESIPKEEPKPLTEEDVKKAAREAALNVVAATTKKEEEERRHRELLEAIRSSQGSKIVEGYKSDAYRFMGQGMDRLASVIEKKEPIKVVVQGARDLLGPAPPEKTVEPEAREEIFKHIKKEFVAEE